MTVTEGCNVRAEASDESEIIGGLDEGTQVEKNRPGRRLDSD